jgi:hypothetical protein
VSNGILSAAAILAAADLKFEDVPVPEWGGSVRIAVMSGLARDEFMTRSDDGYSNFQARLLMATAIDESGVRLFNADQLAALQGKNKDVLDRLTAVAMRINGMGQTAQESIAKNSEAVANGASGSGSPGTSASQ